MESTVGTFGNSQRFSDKIIGKGKDSPRDRAFYMRNSQKMMDHEAGRSCTLNVCDRPDVVLPGSKHVGPGSYDVLFSATKTKSSLDGAEFCSTTLKGKLPSTLVPAKSCSPGPHAKYEIRKAPGYGLPSPSLGKRHEKVEDNTGPGPGQYATQSVKSIAASASCPAFRHTGTGQAGNIALDAVGGTKQYVKTTFGNAERFPSAGKSCSPTGDMYYDHFKFPNKEDYLGMSRSCTFGRGHKTDFTNPGRGHRLSVSPATYSPNTSTTAKTSALDGFANRCTSPVHAHCRSLRHDDDLRGMARSRRTFPRSGDALPMSGFMSGFGAEAAVTAGGDGQVSP